MHRSGTSLTASWLQLCGLRLDDGRVWGSSAGNPRGHFEDKDFVDLHDKAIKQRGKATHGWKIRSGNFLSFVYQEQCRAKSLVEQRSGKYSQWGWKDPRTVLFLQDWKTIIPDMKALLIWRPCSEVVDSLVRRSRKTEQLHLKAGLLESVQMWLHYNDKVCKYKKQNRRDTVLLSLDCLLEQDHRAFELIKKRFDLDLVYHPLAELYDPKLLHRRRSSMLIRFVCGCYRATVLEKRLSNLSDLNGLGC